MEQDILELRGGTLSSRAFIERHGEEALNLALGIAAPAPPPPTEEPVEEEGRGFVGTVADVFQGIGRGIIGAPTETLETMVNANAMPQAQFDSQAQRVVDYRNQVLVGRGLPPMTPEEEAAHIESMGITLAGGGMAPRTERADFDTQEVIDAVGLTDALEVDTVAGSMAEGVSQFLTGFALLGGARTFMGSMLKGAVVDATVFDPYEANMSSFVEEFPHLQNPITEVLAIDPDDPEWMNRARNSIEGGVTGVAVEGLVRTLRVIAVGRKANTEITELGQISDATAEELDNAHRAASELDQTQRAEGSGRLNSNPDGTFTAPDGTTYKPDGDTGSGFEALKPIDLPPPRGEVSPLPQPSPRVADDFSNIKPLDLPPPPRGEFSPLQQPAVPRMDQPVGLESIRPIDLPPPSGATSRLITPEGRTLSPQGRALGAQVADEVIPVRPKIELIDTEAMQEAMARSIEMGDFELRNIDEGGWFNLTRMEGPVDAAKVIDSMQEVLVGTRGAAAMGLTTPETHEQVVRGALRYTAENTGTDVNRLIRDLGVTETVSRDMASRIVAGKMALQSTGRQISGFARQLEEARISGTATEEMDEQLINLMQMHVELQANVKGLQTSAARATSAGRIITNDGLTDGAIDVLSAFGGSARVRNLAKNIASITDDASRSRFIAKAVDRKWLQVLNEFWINSILSGPTTHALNITSNAINVLVRPAERAVGAAVMGDAKEVQAALRTYKALVYNLSDSVRLAARSGWNQRPTLDAAAKIENMSAGANNRAISSEYLGFGGTAMDLMGKSLTMPSRMLGTEDEFFKQLSFRSNLQARLETDAAYMHMDEIRKAGFETRDEWVRGNFDEAFTSKIDAEERWQEAVMMGKVVDDPEVKEQFISRIVGSSKQGNQYAEAALTEARHATFTNPLRKGTISAGMQTLANKHPFLRQITPFIQTPINVMAQASDRTPALNMLREGYRNELRSPDPAVRAQARGKMATGIAIYGTLGFLANEGRISGGGPVDPKLAQVWRNSPDWQPYSINFGTAEEPHWVSYARMDPWTTAFGIMGDMAEMNKARQLADNDGADMGAMFIAAVGNNIVSKTYLQGIADTVDLMNSKDSPWEVGNFFSRRMASLMPMSGFTNQVGNLNDEYMREARGYLDTLRRSTGIGRASLPIKYDWVTGQPMEGPDTLGAAFHITEKGVEPNETDAQLIYSEFRRLGAKFEGARRTISGVELTSAQYQRWNELVGTVRIGRNTLQERLIRTIESNRYDYDGPDYGLLTASESPRVALLNRDLARYRDKARNELYREFPEIREQVRAYERFLRNPDPDARPVTNLNDL